MSTQQVSAVPVDRRYRALLDHCHGCHACNADPTRACPEAARLRRAWSRVRRGATA